MWWKRLEKDVAKAVEDPGGEQKDDDGGGDPVAASDSVRGLGETVVGGR